MRVRGCTSRSVAEPSTPPTGRVSWADVRPLTEAIGGDFDAESTLPIAAPRTAGSSGGGENGRTLARPGRDAGRGRRWGGGQVDVLLVEGVGGFLCPLTEDKTIADLAVALGLSAAGRRAGRTGND